MCHFQYIISRVHTSINTTFHVDPDHLAPVMFVRCLTVQFLVFSSILDPVEESHYAQPICRSEELCSTKNSSLHCTCLFSHLYHLFCCSNCCTFGQQVLLLMPSLLPLVSNVPLVFRIWLRCYLLQGKKFLQTTPTLSPFPPITLGYVFSYVHLKFTSIMVFIHCILIHLSLWTISFLRIGVILFYMSSMYVVHSVSLAQSRSLTNISRMIIMVSLQSKSPGVPKILTRSHTEVGN